MFNKKFIEENIKKEEWIKLKNAAENTQGVLGPLKDQLEHIKGYIEQGECIIHPELSEEKNVSLNQDELDFAKKLEISIEEQLDAKYIPDSQKPIMVNIRRGTSDKIIEYIKTRFPGWKIGVPELLGSLYPFMALDEINHE